jgi:hypothetical protein
MLIELLKNKGSATEEQIAQVILNRDPGTLRMAYGACYWKRRMLSFMVAIITSARAAIAVLLWYNSNFKHVNKMPIVRRNYIALLMGINKNMVDPPSEASIKGDSLALVKNRANPRAILAPMETHSNRMIIFSIGLDYSSHSGHDVDLPHHGGRTSNFS